MGGAFSHTEDVGDGVPTAALPATGPHAAAAEGAGTYPKLTTNPESETASRSPMPKSYPNLSPARPTEKHATPTGPAPLPTTAAAPKGTGPRPRRSGGKGKTVYRFSPDDAGIVGWRVRANPSTSAPTIAVLSRDEPFHVLYDQGEWAKIKGAKKGSTLVGWTVAVLQGKPVLEPLPGSGSRPPAPGLPAEISQAFRKLLREGAAEASGEHAEGAASRGAPGAPTAHPAPLGGAEPGAPRPNEPAGELGGVQPDAEVRMMRVRDALRAYNDTKAVAGGGKPRRGHAATPVKPGGGAAAASAGAGNQAADSQRALQFWHVHGDARELERHERGLLHPPTVPAPAPVQIRPPRPVGMAQDEVAIPSFSFGHNQPLKDTTLATLCNGGRFDAPVVCDAPLVLSTETMGSRAIGSGATLAIAAGSAATCCGERRRSPTGDNPGQRAAAGETAAPMPSVIFGPSGFTFNSILSGMGGAASSTPAFVPHNSIPSVEVLREQSIIRAAAVMAKQRECSSTVGSMRQLAHMPFLPPQIFHYS